MLNHWLKLFDHNANVFPFKYQPVLAESYDGNDSAIPEAFDDLYADRTM